MNQHNNGGPAFPHENYQLDGGMFGMTLSDYFAAHAPITWSDAIDSLDSTGECVGPWPGSKILERLVLLRTDYADAMMHAREQQ